MRVVYTNYQTPVYHSTHQCSSKVETAVTSCLQLYASNYLSYIHQTKFPPLENDHLFRIISDQWESKVDSIQWNGILLKRN